MPLTPKQRAFVEAYTGNATEAARAAGYSGNDATLGQVGHENLKKPEIAAAIAERQAPVAAGRIATRAERQSFWTSVMVDVGTEMQHRLKASELLGRSEVDFTEKVQHEGGLVVNVIDPYSKKTP